MIQTLIDIYRHTLLRAILSILILAFTGTLHVIVLEDRGLEAIKFKHHLLICGWKFRGEEVPEILQKNRKQASPIVSINQLPEEAVTHIINNFSGLKIKFVRGDHTTEQVLNRAAVANERGAVILPDTSSGPGDQDRINFRNNPEAVTILEDKDFLAAISNEGANSS